MMECHVDEPSLGDVPFPLEATWASKDICSRTPKSLFALISVCFREFLIFCIFEFADYFLKDFLDMVSSL